MLKAIAFILAAIVATSPLFSQKPVIASGSDVPDVRFAVSVPTSTLIGSPAFMAMLPAMRAEAERLLADYDVRDPNVAGRLRQGLAAIAILEGRRIDADRLIAEYRASQVKPQQQRLGALPLDLAVAQLGATVANRCQLAAARFSMRIDGVKPTDLRDAVVTYNALIQTSSAAFYSGLGAGSVDAGAKTRGSIGILDGMLLAEFEVAATNIPPCRDALSQVAQAWLNLPANAPTDIWPARQPNRSLFGVAHPVVVAVWDAGFDTSLFPGQLAQDPAEPIDGRDNDGDGVLDDSNGPTWDAKLMPRASSIAPPSSFLQPRLAAQAMLNKGESDLDFGFDTLEARLYAERARTASPVEQGQDRLAADEYNGRSHGTACASEIADGQPFVRLYNVSAIPWGSTQGPFPDAYDESTFARWAAAIQRVGERMRKAGVRAVNMSWTLTADEISQQLLQRGLEKDAGRAKARGISMQRTISDALLSMMTASPDILFVAIAGDTNQPDDILASTPGNLTLPNLMIIGAAGRNGRPTTFTTYGKHVDLYAQGDEVPLRLPGDIVSHESGTSMAAPLVVRAAAAMLALNPGLEASQVKTGLLSTATPGENGLKLLDPASAVRWAATPQPLH